MMTRGPGAPRGLATGTDSVLLAGPAMRQPLVPPVLALAVGILVSDRWPASIPAAVTGMAAAAALLAVPRLRTPALWFLCLVSGLLHHTLWQAPLNPADLRHVTPAEPVIGQIEAVLLEPPRVRPAHARDRSGGRLTVLARAVAWIPADGIRQPVRGRVMISSPGPPDDGLWRGRRVRVDGVLRPPPEARAPGLFDYRRHLAVRGVHRQVVADGPADWFLPGPAPERPPLLERWRRGAHEVLARGLPDDEAARLIRGMLLGWRTALTEEL